MARNTAEGRRLSRPRRYSKVALLCSTLCKTVAVVTTSQLVTLPTRHTVKSSHVTSWSRAELIGSRCRDKHKLTTDGFDAGTCHSALRHATYYWIAET